MIHIATVHFITDKWISLQLSHLRRNMTDFKLWAFCDGNIHGGGTLQPEGDEWDASEFHFCGPSRRGTHGGASRSHAAKLDALVRKISKDESSHPDDIILFLDGDAFPVAPVNDYLTSTLRDFSLGAIQRQEMNQSFPHPSFAFCTLGFWMENDLTWAVAQGLDTGGKLGRFFKHKNIPWKPLLRSHSLTAHPIFFGVYDSLAYHHGAGFRKPFTKWDKKHQKFSAEFRKDMSEQIFSQLSNPSLFSNLSQKDQDEN